LYRLLQLREKQRRKDYQPGTPKPRTLCCEKEMEKEKEEKKKKKKKRSNEKKTGQTESNDDVTEHHPFIHSFIHSL